MPILAYSQLAKGSALSTQLINDSFMKELVQKYETTPLSTRVTVRTEQVLSIPKTVQDKYVKEIAAAAKIELTTGDLNKLEETFP
jgi:diketogulonate reductase-like aldo/keto reductase